MIHQQNKFEPNLPLNYNPNGQRPKGQEMPAKNNVEGDDAYEQYYLEEAQQPEMPNQPPRNHDDSQKPKYSFDQLKEVSQEQEN